MTDHMMMTLSIFCGNLKCPSWTNKLFGNHNINLEINSEKFLELFNVSQHQGIHAQEPVLGSVGTVWSVVRCGPIGARTTQCVDP